MTPARDHAAMRHLAAIVVSSCEAIMSVDLDGVVLTWNRAAETLLGHPPGEVVGRSVLELFAEEHRHAMTSLLQRVRAGYAASSETLMCTKSGVPLDVALTVSPVGGGTGGLEGASIVARDITESRWMARTLDAMLAKLEESLRQAQEAEARQRRFLADAAHQLRTPIARIRAAGEAILRGLSDDERDELLAGLVRETANAGRLVSSLLRMARLDQFDPIRPQPCDVAALCEEECAAVAAQAPAVALTTRFDARGRTRPQLDPNAVSEILANVLDNARRHAAQRIDVCVAVSENVVEIRVVDDGPGVPAHVTGRIFDRFVSLDDRGGSGLGLAIARELARAHGGDLTYEIAAQAFVLSLPARPTAGPHTPRVST